MSIESRVSNESFGKVIAPRTVEIQRLLPGPMERIWDYLTQSDLRRQWLASGDMGHAPGSTFTLTWRNDELATTSPGTRPADKNVEHSQDGVIQEWDPPRKLVYTWNGYGLVTFQLAPAGQRVLLTLTHSGLPSRGAMLGVSTGWHAHLDVLVAVAEGRKGAPFWDHMNELRPAYDKAIPSEI
jgi:uncharacterized protein YndB with AHSA1/START domain